MELLWDTSPGAARPPPYKRLGAPNPTAVPSADATRICAPPLPLQLPLLPLYPPLPEPPAGSRPSSCPWAVWDRAGGVQGWLGRGLPRPPTAVRRQLVLVRRREPAEVRQLPLQWEGRGRSRAAREGSVAPPALRGAGGVHEPPVRTLPKSGNRGRGWKWLRHPPPSPVGSRRWAQRGVETQNRWVTVRGEGPAAAAATGMGLGGWLGDGCLLHPTDLSPRGSLTP